MKIRIIHWMLLSIMFLSFPSFFVYAEGNDFEFRVEPIYPESQIGNQGYYHLKGNPNETITLQAKVINDSENELKVTISILNAFSGYQGILYQTEPILEGTAITNDEFLLTKYVKNPEELVLGPLESEIVEFSVKVPAINGTLLGSIEFRVFQGTEELTKNEGNSGLLIDQYKAVNLGVQVEITDYMETPFLIFNIPQYSPEQIAIMVPIGNPHPVIVPNIAGSYEVTKSTDESFSLSGEIPAFKMAPMTAFLYPLRWTGGMLEPGDYNVTFTLNVDGQTQTYEQLVTIKNEEIIETLEKMEDRGEIQIAPETFPWTIVIIVLLLLMVIILLWMMKRSKPQRKDRKYPGQDPNES